jgi:hypothetical protein
MKEYLKQPEPFYGMIFFYFLFCAVISLYEALIFSLCERLIFFLYEL